MLFPLPCKCHFLKEALHPPPTPSLGLIPVHLPMTQEALSQLQFYTDFGYYSNSLCNPLPPWLSSVRTGVSLAPVLPVVPGNWQPSILTLGWMEPV